MKSQHGFTLIELMIVVMILGLLAAIAVPNYIGMRHRAREASTKTNCHTVQLAAEEFCILNGGVYPTDHDTDTSPDGSRLIDLLPNGELLENPFTRARTEPVTAAIASNEGEVAYSPTMQGGMSVGYTITGAGVNGVVITMIGYE